MQKLLVLESRHDYLGRADSTVAGQPPMTAAGRKLRAG